IGAAGNTSADAAAWGYPVFILSSATPDKWYALYRGIYLFDTSGLPDDAPITAATLSIRGRSLLDQFVPPINADINVYASAPASDTALVNGDYDSLGAVAFSTAIPYGSISIVGYNDFILNASGIAAIDKTGVSKFGARNANYDVSGNPPAWQGSKQIQIAAYFTEQGAGFKPMLVVTYTVETAYNTMVGNPTSWVWEKCDYGASEQCPVGSELSWAWKAPTSGGPDKTPQGSPTSFSWGSE
ncbi:unnamed protein product, partial [marine sediment metagenome]